MKGNEIQLFLIGRIIILRIDNCDAGLLCATHIKLWYLL